MEKNCNNYRVNLRRVHSDITELNWTDRVYQRANRAERAYWSLVDAYVGAVT